MTTHADKSQENKSQSVADAVSQRKSGGKSVFQFVDNRSKTIAQRKLQELANESPQVRQLSAYQDMANNSLQAKQVAQLQAMANNHVALQQQPIQKIENNTGLPDDLKSGMENLSGYTMDDVKVHYNSDKPAQLQAHAYAQGTDIHLAPGQEKHLQHEAWHVVQQRQGRVKPTMQMKGNVNINEDAGLEKEADVMGNKVMQMQSIEKSPFEPPIQFFAPVVQRTKWLYTGGKLEDTSNRETVRDVDETTPELKEGDTWDDRTNVVTHAASRLNAIFAGEEIYPEVRPKGLPATRDFAKGVGGGAVPETVDYEDIKDKLTAVFRKPENRSKFSQTVKKEATIKAIGELLEETLPPDMRRAALNNEAFAWQMMRVINELAFGKQIPLINTDIGGERFAGEQDMEQSPAYAVINSYQWSVRHFTDKPGYQDLKSSTELEVLDKIKGQNTRDKDWNKLGNTDFGFYLLAINGTVGSRGFLSKMTHYAEFPMLNLPGKIFVSGDLLEIDSDTIHHVRAYTGSGANVKHELVLLLTHHYNQSGQGGGPSPQWCIDMLEKLMHMLEVKVPKSLRVTQWNRL